MCTQKDNMMGKGRQMTVRGIVAYFRGKELGTGVFVEAVLSRQKECDWLYWWGVAWKLQEKGCTMGKGSVKGCRRVYVYW